MHDTIYIAFMSGGVLLRAALPFIHPYYQRPSHGMLVVIVVGGGGVVACVVVFIQTEHPNLIIELTPYFDDRVLGYRNAASWDDRNSFILGMCQP